MTPGYCYFCDEPVATDPCPTCGKALYRPAYDVSNPTPEPPPKVVTADTATTRQLPPWLKYVVAAAVLIVIAFLLRSPFGI